MAPALIDKQRVAESFSRAASSYDSVAELQRSVGESLFDSLPDADFSACQVMDLGCGTGYFSPFLRERYPTADLLNLDLALGMLQYAKQNRPVKGAQWLCADAEQLPLADNTVSLIFSSLAIQWCENLPQLFAEIARVLKPGGHFCFATLGPQTLLELRNAWQQVDSFVHVNEFQPVSEIRASIPAELELKQLNEEFRVLRYNQLRELTDELKGIGAHNMNAGQQTGLTGREHIRRFRQAYEAQRTSEGFLPATYQVCYGQLTKKTAN